MNESKTHLIYVPVGCHACRSLYACQYAGSGADVAPADYRTSHSGTDLSTDPT